MGLEAVQISYHATRGEEKAKPPYWFFVDNTRDVVKVQTYYYVIKICVLFRLLKQVFMVNNYKSNIYFYMERHIREKQNWIKVSNF